MRSILDLDPSQLDACSPHDGATSVMFAAMTGQLEIAQLLVERGCDINKQDTISGWTALMQATYHGLVMARNMGYFNFCMSSRSTGFNKDFESREKPCFL